MAQEPFDPYERWLGIGPDDRPIDYYRLLGVPRFESDVERIVAAAEERMRHLRTFQTGPRGIHTQKILNELAKAKLRLLDATTKLEYDRRLHESAQAAADFLVDDDIGLPEPLADDVPAMPEPIVGPPYIAAPVAAPVAAQPATSTWAGDAPAAPIINTLRPMKRRSGSPASYFGLALCLIATVAVGGGLYHVARERNLWMPREDSPAGERPTGQGPPSNLKVNSALTYQDAAGKVTLTPRRAIINGASPRLVLEPTDESIADWTSVDDWLEWPVHIRKKNVFQATVRYAASGRLQGARFRLEIGGQSREWDMRAPVDGSTFVEDTVLIQVIRPGEGQLALRLAREPDESDDLSVTIHSIVLVPYHRAL